MRARKRLVIDASVICASGPLGLIQNVPLTGEDLTPRQCQEVLDHIRDLGYRVVRMPAIVDEWERCLPETAQAQRGKYATAWLRAMTRQNRFYLLDPPLRADLRRKIEELAIDEGIRKI